MGVGGRRHLSQRVEGSYDHRPSKRHRTDYPRRSFLGDAIELLECRVAADDLISERFEDRSGGEELVAEGYE